MLSNKTKEILRKSGWTEDREVSIHEDLNVLNEDGFFIFQAVKDVLQKYSGLRLEFLNQRNNIVDDITFSIQRATNLEVPERLNEDYMPRINKKLCLIGSLYREYMVLMIAEDYSIYGGYDDYLVFMGSNISEAIENIVMNKEFIEIT